MASTHQGIFAQLMGFGEEALLLVDAKCLNLRPSAICCAIAWGKKRMAVLSDRPYQPVEKVAHT